ncbi:unnamed protein product [Phytomonas sp. Hart1]|nr:unnamed protein product [Phytomonas sp. Hart1]|eukprot:CCW70150.1 unnamed protein product [Phytomonas sp. isolate Hart1]
MDFTQEELTIRRQRMYERCRDELLANYVENYRGVAGNAKKDDVNFSQTSSSTSRNASLSWEGGMQAQLHAISRTGLSKEVLYIVGSEYRRVVKYFDAQYTPHGLPSSHNEGKRLFLPLIVFSRLRDYFGEVCPHRWRNKYMKLRYFIKIRGSTFKNSEFMINLAWYFGVDELERTARVIAFSILFDPLVSAEEVSQRREALLALSELFRSYGQPYKGADSSTINQLINSLREYQQQQEKKSY